MTPAGKIDKSALRRDAASRVAKEMLDTSPGFSTVNTEITAEDGPNGRIVVTVTLPEQNGRGQENLAEAGARLLSGFPFDHKIVVRDPESRRRDSLDPFSIQLR
jgi:hypothetical protein